MPFTPFSGTLVANGGISITGSFPAGNMITLTNTAVAPTDADLVVIGAASGDRTIGSRVAGDTFSRNLVGSDGSIKFASGSGGADVVIGRSSAGILAQSAGSFDVTNVGQGLRVIEGTNAKQGTATLVAGTVTVANTAVTANSRIFLTSQVLGGTAGAINVTSRVAGTSFTVTSTNAADTSTFAYEIFEPG